MDIRALPPSPGGWLASCGPSRVRGRGRGSRGLRARRSRRGGNEVLRLQGPVRRTKPGPLRRAGPLGSQEDPSPAQELRDRCGGPTVARPVGPRNGSTAAIRRGERNSGALHCPPGRLAGPSSPKWNAPANRDHCFGRSRGSRLHLPILRSAEPPIGLVAPADGGVARLRKVTSGATPTAAPATHGVGSEAGNRAPVRDLVKRFSATFLATQTLQTVRTIAGVHGPDIAFYLHFSGKRRWGPHPEIGMATVRDAEVAGSNPAVPTSIRCRGNRVPSAPATPRAPLSPRGFHFLRSLDTLAARKLP